MMQAMTAADRRQLAEGLAACGANGWLLFNFQGHNPVATRMLGIRGLGSRRIFVLLRPDQEPVALVHKIELQPEVRSWHRTAPSEEGKPLLTIRDSTPSCNRCMRMRRSPSAAATERRWISRAKARP